MGELDLFSAAAMPEEARGFLTIAEVNRQARYLIETALGSFWVKGEVSGFKSYRSGHWYFALRDSTAQVRCVMWRSDNQQLREPPGEGTDVFAQVRPTVWEERGEFRLTVKQLLPTAAEGSWQLQLERARHALEKDGLLDPSRKRPLPRYPDRIGVVTSPDGAAFRDIVTVLRKRWPVELILVPALVQGDGAETSLLSALKVVGEIQDLDLVILARGGGSREDLWVFNSERVARSFAKAPVPTVSAVGHETDVSLTDLVADVRAPTPSAAAELVVPDREEISYTIDSLARRIAAGMSGRLTWGRERLERTSDRLFAGVTRTVESGTNRVAELAAALNALSPLRVLGRGYSVARDADGNVLKRLSQFTVGEEFKLTVSDGDVAAKVKGKDG